MNYIKKALSAFRDFLFLATRHWVSAIGVALASFAAISFLAILAVNISGEEQGNYQGIVSYIILPTIFGLGLVLIPIGLRLLRRREKAGKPTGFPVLDFNDPRLRTIAQVGRSGWNGRWAPHSSTMSGLPLRWQISVIAARTTAGRPSAYGCPSRMWGPPSSRTTCPQRTR